MPLTGITNPGKPVFVNTIPIAGILRHHDSGPTPYFNPLADTILAGEPFFHQGVVCISNKPIYGRTWGEAYSSWVADLIVNPALATNILQGDQLWWSYALDVHGTSVGAVAVAAPTNGFIVGRAVGNPDSKIVSNKAVVAGAGSTHVRVASLEQVATAIGTVPLFN